MIITYPLANSGLTNLKMTGFEMNTAGFKFVKSEPAFPVTAPASGSIIIKIYAVTIIDHLKKNKKRLKNVLS
jgi:hypothetical protein